MSTILYDLASTRATFARYLEKNLHMDAFDAASLCKQITRVWKEFNVTYYSTVGSGRSPVRGSHMLLQHLMGPERYAASLPLPPVRLLSGAAKYSGEAFIAGDVDYVRSKIVEYLHEDVGLSLPAAVAAASGLVLCGKREHQLDPRKQLFWTARTPSDRPIESTVALLIDLVGGEGTPEDLAKLERRTGRHPSRAGCPAKARKMLINFRSSGSYAEADLEHCRAQVVAHMHAHTHTHTHTHTHAHRRRASAAEASEIAARLVQVRFAVGASPRSSRRGGAAAPAGEFYARTSDGAVCRTANHLLRCLLGDELFRRELDDRFSLLVRPAEEKLDDNDEEDERPAASADERANDPDSAPLAGAGAGTGTGAGAGTLAELAAAAEQLSNEPPLASPSDVRRHRHRTKRRLGDEVAQTSGDEAARLREEISVLRTRLAGEVASKEVMMRSAAPSVAVEAERAGHEAISLELAKIAASEGSALANSVLRRIMMMMYGVQLPPAAPPPP